MRNIFREVVEEEFLVNVVIQKSLSQAPLSCDELKIFQTVDFGTLIVEYALTYPEAVEVMAWAKNESQRAKNQYLYIPNKDCPAPVGARPGSPGLNESYVSSGKKRVKITRRQIRHIIKENLAI